MVAASVQSHPMFALLIQGLLNSFDDLHGFYKLGFYQPVNMLRFLFNSPYTIMYVYADDVGIAAMCTSETMEANVFGRFRMVGISDNWRLCQTLHYLSRAIGTIEPREE